MATLAVSQKRTLTANVIAVKTRGLPERPALEIVLYYLPTGSQIILDANGKELRRSFQDTVGQRELGEVLRNTALMAQALELAR